MKVKGLIKIVLRTIFLLYISSISLAVFILLVVKPKQSKDFGFIRYSIAVVGIPFLVIVPSTILFIYCRRKPKKPDTVELIEEKI